MFLPPAKLSDIVIVWLRNLITLVTRTHREEANDSNLNLKKKSIEFAVKINESSDKIKQS